MGIIFDRPLESVFSATGFLIENVAPEDDGVGLGELGVGARVNGWMTSGISVLHPDGRGVVLGVEGTLGDTIANARVEFVSGQFGQVGVDHVVAGIVGVCATHIKSKVLRK